MASSAEKLKQNPEQSFLKGVSTLNTVEFQPSQLRNRVPWLTHLVYDTNTPDQFP